MKSVSTFSSRFDSFKRNYHFQASDFMKEVNEFQALIDRETHSEFTRSQRSKRAGGSCISSTTTITALGLYATECRTKATVLLLHLQGPSPQQRLPMGTVPTPRHTRKSPPQATPTRLAHTKPALQATDGHTPTAMCHRRTTHR